MGGFNPFKMLDKLAESLWTGPGSFRVYTVILVLAILGWFYWKHELSNAPNLYVKELTSYLVEEGVDSYRLGVTLDLVNKDNNKVWIVNGVRQRGSFAFDVTKASIILQTVGILKGDGDVIGTYHLSAGGRTIVKIKAQQLIQMHIVGGDPKLLLDMNWELILDKKTLKVTPEKLVTNGVISSTEWDHLNGVA